MRSDHPAEKLLFLPVHRIPRHPTVGQRHILLFLAGQPVNLRKLAVERGKGIVRRIRISDRLKRVCPALRRRAVALIRNITCHAGGKHILLPVTLRHRNTFPYKRREKSRIGHRKKLVGGQPVFRNLECCNAFMAGDQIQVMFTRFFVNHNIEVADLFAERPVILFLQLIRPGQSVRS